MVVTQKELTKAVIKADGNLTKAADLLGIRKQSVAGRLKRKPSLKQKILNVREEAMKKAGITRERVYKRISQGLDACIVDTVDGLSVKTKILDAKEIREYVKISLQLFRDLDPDKEQSTTNIGQVIFNLLQKPNRETIKVV